MSDAPIRPSHVWPPSYDSIQTIPLLYPSHHQSLPTTASADHLQIASNLSPVHQSTAYSAQTLPKILGQRRQSKPIEFPATISPVPFRTSSGKYFVPNTPMVIVPPRQMVSMVEQRSPNPPNPNDDDASEDSSSELHCASCYENMTIKRTLYAFLLGQVMSLCLTGTGIGSELLAKHKFNAPAAQNFFNYFLLFFVYGLIIACRSGEDRNMLNVLKARGWKYLVLAFVDVQANYFIVYAYQFTNLTSVQILDCSVIPVVMILSWLFLSVRYLIPHLVGVSICLIGIGLIIYADAMSGKGAEGGNNRLLGDLLCLGAAILYGVANVTEEFLVKQYDRFEYLGMVGLFGALISCIQTAIFEHSAIATFQWSATTLLEYALYTICMFSFYSIVSMVMEQTSALMFNLAALSSDFYTLLAGIFIFAYSFNFLYLLSFFVVITGSVIYSVKRTKERSRAEANLASKILCFCCPCAACLECKPKAAYTIREAQRTPSISLETPPSSSSTHQLDD